MTCVACYCHFQAWGPGKTPSAGKESGLNGMPTGRAVATIHTWDWDRTLTSSLQRGQCDVLVMLKFLFQFCYLPAVTLGIIAFSLTVLTFKMGRLSMGGCWEHCLLSYIQASDIAHVIQAPDIVPVPG